MKLAKLMKYLGCFAAVAAAALTMVTASTQEPRILTVQQIMQELLVPNTATLWGAYDIKTDEQWQELSIAAQQVILAGELLLEGGSLQADRENAGKEDWREYTNQMIEAGRSALTAINNRDEAALSSAGNDQLYPPCEGCHARYMQQ